MNKKAAINATKVAVGVSVAIGIGILLFSLLPPLPAFLVFFIGMIWVGVYAVESS